MENINYLLPIDQKLATATSLDLKRLGISLRWIESMMRQGSTAVSVIVVDACRNTLMRGVPQQGMVAAPAARGTLTFYSTAPGALARDGAGKNSDFTGAFNRYLANPDLSLKQVIELTQSDVSAETADTQVPWINSGLVGDVRLSTAQKLEQTPFAKNRTSGTPAANNRGANGDPATVSASFWNENLTQLEEQVQFAVMNFDINNKPVLEQRAAAGDVMALTILGSVYSMSDAPKVRITRSTYGLEAQSVRQSNGVVTKDSARAVHYLTPAAKRRFPVAQTLLAELLMEAPRGVPRDFQRAENLLQDAATTGYGRARLDLIDLKMRQGNISPQDLLENGKTMKKYIERFQVPKS